MQQFHRKWCMCYSQGPPAGGPAASQLQGTEVVPGCTAARTERPWEPTHSPPIWEKVWEGKRICCMKTKNTGRQTTAEGHQTAPYHAIMSHNKSEIWREREVELEVEEKTRGNKGWRKRKDLGWQIRTRHKRRIKKTEQGWRFNKLWKVPSGVRQCFCLLSVLLIKTHCAYSWPNKQPECISFLAKHLHALFTCSRVPLVVTISTGCL